MNQHREQTSTTLFTKEVCWNPFMQGWCRIQKKLWDHQIFEYRRNRFFSCLRLKHDENLIKASLQGYSFAHSNKLLISSRTYRLYMIFSHFSSIQCIVQWRTNRENRQSSWWWEKRMGGEWKQRLQSDAYGSLFLLPTFPGYFCFPWF